MRKEVEPKSEEKEKPIIFVQETETAKKEDEVLMKWLVTREPAHKQTASRKQYLNIQGVWAEQREPKEDQHLDQ